MAGDSGSRGRSPPSSMCSWTAGDTGGPGREQKCLQAHCYCYPQVILGKGKPHDCCCMGFQICAPSPLTMFAVLAWGLQLQEAALPSTGQGWG